MPRLKPAKWIRILSLIVLPMLFCNCFIISTVSTVGSAGLFVGKTAVKTTYGITKFAAKTTYKVVTFPFPDGEEAEIQKGDKFIMQASWYGNDYEGKQTANGDIFDPDKLTAAHKSLPLGTKLLVMNPESGKKVKVIVNDRGPYIAGRDLDLSQRAAEKLKMMEKGVSTVKVKILKLP